MHRLLIAVVLVGSSQIVGCDRRNDQGVAPGRGSPAGQQTTAANIPSAQVASAATPKAEVRDAEPSPAHDVQPTPGGAAAAAGSAPATAPPDSIADPTSGPTEPGSPSAGAATDDGGASTPVRPETSWSTQRLVLLAPGGPRMIDLRINAAGGDLATGLAQTAERLAEQLEFDFEDPITWEALLEKPLVQSGWLGNLVPTAEQRAELLSMYDKENVGKVDAAEFQAFVTRGLAKRDPVRLVRARAAAPLIRSLSRWGPLDQDGDGELNKSELSSAAAALGHYDFDGDGIVSERELRSTGDTMASAANMSQSAGLLELAVVLTSDAKQPTALERTVFEQYTFADTLPRDAFSRWDEQRWNELDQKATGQVTKRDLARLQSMVPDAQVDVALPNSLREETNATEAAVSCDLQPTAWTPGPTGGRLSLPGCVVVVQIRDDHSWQARRYASQQFARALADPQLQASFAGPLELKDGAWELLPKADGAAASAQAWQWLVGSRHFHATVSWGAVESPWFELVDADGDRRLTGAELSQFHRAIQAWDENLNGTLEEDETPLVISLAIAREDNRLAFLSGGTNMEKGGASSPVGPSWFTGMDYNLDGGVTHAEFLGDDRAFQALDSNDDGIIDVREVYAPH